MVNNFLPGYNAPNKCSKGFDAKPATKMRAGDFPGGLTVVPAGAFQENSNWYTCPKDTARGVGQDIGGSNACIGSCSALFSKTSSLEPAFLEVMNSQCYSCPLGYSKNLSKSALTFSACEKN